MAGRDEMMDRIRKALGHSTSSSAPPSDLASLFPKLEPVLPTIPPGELVSTFEAEFTKVSGVAHRASNPGELEGIIRAILDGAKTTSVVLTRNPLLEKVGLARILTSLGISTGRWPNSFDAAAEADQRKAYRDQCFAAQVGISGVEMVLAETGTLVLTSHTEGSQLASLAPPVHMALYRRSQVVGSLEEVLESLPITGGPSSTSAGRSFVFVTGTSRTADIEQILIRGVHGPGEVHAILVEDACLV